MFKNLIIKKIVAASLLIVFAFSITPTIVFHNWLAGHSDTVKKTFNTTGKQLGKQTFNCHCDNIVAESPFTGPGKIIPATPIVFLSIKQAADIAPFISPTDIFHSLRGPPAV